MRTEIGMVYITEFLGCALAMRFALNTLKLTKCGH